MRGKPWLMSERQPRCLMSERQTRCLMSKQQPRRLTSERRTKRHLHQKFNVNQLLRTIVDIHKLNGWSATWSKILARQSAKGTNQQPLLDVIAQSMQ